MSAAGRPAGPARLKRLALPSAGHLSIDQEPEKSRQRPARVGGPLPGAVSLVFEEISPWTCNWPKSGGICSSLAASARRLAWSGSGATLVALGAAIFVTYARIGLDNEGAARMAAQVVSGIGFLGAGVIFKEGLNVRGLNTAATLWCSAGVGLIAGEGFALFGLLAALLVIGANTALRPISHAINRQPRDTIEEEQRYLISIDCRAADASDV
jgi:hypothetical protein